MRGTAILRLSSKNAHLKQVMSTGIDIDRLILAYAILCPSYPKSPKLRFYVFRVLESKLQKVKHRFSCSCHGICRSTFPARKQKTADLAVSTCFKNRWKTWGIHSVLLSETLRLRNLADFDGTYGAFNLSVSGSSGQRKLEFLG